MQTIDNPSKQSYPMKGQKKMKAWGKKREQNLWNGDSKAAGRQKRDVGRGKERFL